MSVATSSTTIQPPSKSAAFSDEQIEDVVRRDCDGIAEWARSTAKDRGLSVRRLHNDELIKAVSRLSDGVINLDPVEQLLVALRRAGVISSYQRASFRFITSEMESRVLDPFGDYKTAG